MNYGIALPQLVPSLVLWIALAAIMVDRGIAAARTVRGAALRVLRWR